MTRMPALPDAPPLLADANARYRRRRWTPLRVFAWTFLLASLVLWLAALPGIRGVGKLIASAWDKSAAHERLEERLPRSGQKEWRPRLD